MNAGERHREMIRYAASKGGRAVTLNFSVGFENLIMTTKDPMRVIGQRMNRELVNCGLRGLPILLILETSRKEKRPHIHGVYIAGEVNPGQVRDAMCKAVGRIYGRAAARQLYQKDIFYPDGWLKYITMDQRSTRRMLRLADDTRLWWVSRAMNQSARAYHDSNRAAVSSNVNHHPKALVS